jgi:hypothetical protein
VKKIFQSKQMNTVEKNFPSQFHELASQKRVCLIMKKRLVVLVSIHHFSQIQSRPKQIGFFALTCLNALGVVYGDIGTSPLYVFSSIFGSEDPKDISSEKVKGALCLIIYALTIVVCIKYLIFILMADFRGEGGVFAVSRRHDSIAYYCDN